MTSKPNTLYTINVTDPSRYGRSRRTIVLLRALVIALMLGLLAVPFVHDMAAQEKTTQDGTAQKEITRQISILQQRAVTGVPVAQFQLGVLYQRGLGVQQNFAKAAHFYYLAARQNHIVSQHNLAILFARGKGVKRNMQKAYGWARLAEIGAQNAMNTMNDALRSSVETLLIALRNQMNNSQINRVEWQIQQVNGIPI